jgi:hypothetical protein
LHQQFDTYDSTLVLQKEFCHLIAMSPLEQAADSERTALCTNVSDPSVQDKKFKTVNLSGPINILVPIDGTEGVSTKSDKQLADRVSLSSLYVFFLL